MLQRALVCNGKENGLSVLNLGATKLIFSLLFSPSSLSLVTANKSHKKHRNKHVVIHNGNSALVYLKARAVNKATFTFLLSEGV